MITTKQLLSDACKAHTNLSMWGAVVGLMESGSFYGQEPEASKARVIKIAKAEMQKELARMDRATARILK